MNRIDQLFNHKKHNILSIYFTAGYPTLNDTEKIIIELENTGVDLIEIGFPFSDPIADGPIIQRSSEIALKNGMTVKLLFEHLKDIRKKVKVPLILMGYLNPVMQFGIHKFCKTASEIGIDGFIIPDLPLEIYIKEYKTIFHQYNIYNIPLIPPQASDERILKIDKATEGFLYLVSSASTTGTKTAGGSKLKEFTNRIERLNLQNPRLIGFGINDKATFENVCQFANGGIIGTAFIQALERPNSISINIHQFINSIKQSFQ